MAQFHHLSICNQNQSISNFVIIQQHTKAIALVFRHKCLSLITFQFQLKSINFNFGYFSAKYQGYSLTFLAKNGSFSTLFNLQSKSINFKVRHLSAKYQDYSLWFWPQMPQFNHFSISIKINQFQIRSVWGQYQGYRRTFWPNLAHFLDVAICNQDQSM